MSGQIHIYCGDGKGKTIAAIGLAIRAAGSDKRVVFAQFFKDGSSSEINVLQTVKNIQTAHCNTVRGFWKRMDDTQKAQASKDYTSFLAEIVTLAKDADLLVLDEIVSACNGILICKKLKDCHRWKSQPTDSQEQDFESA